MNALKGKLMPQRDHTWLVQSIAFFRELHFFQQFAHLSNEALASELLRKWQEMFDTPLDLSRPYTDLDIVMWDTERVWWEDLEADVCAGNDIYIETLERWGKISRGSLQPLHIRERWASATGPIRVDFEHQGQHLIVHPAYLDDYIDINILPPINRAMQQSGIELVVYKPFDQTAFVVALTSEERRALEFRRGWQFAELASTT